MVRGGCQGEPLLQLEAVEADEVAPGGRAGALQGGPVVRGVALGCDSIDNLGSIKKNLTLII